MAVHTPTAFTSSAVQTACDTCYGVGGGMVYCAAGTYNWTGQVTIKSAVQVVGDGWGLGTDGTATLFKQANSTNINGAMLKFYTSNGTDANCHNAGIHRLRLDGNKANNSGQATQGISAVTNPLWNASTNDNSSIGWDMHNSITDVHVWNMKGDGYNANGRSEMNLSRVFIRGCDGNGFVPSADTNLSQCVAGVNGLAGFLIDGQGSVRLTCCKAWYSGQVTAASGHGFYINNCNSGTVILDGCEAQDNKAAGYYINASMSCVLDVVADSNSTSGAGSYPAVLLNNSHGNVINCAAMDRAGSGTQTYVLKLNGTSRGNFINATNRWLNNPGSSGGIDPGSTNTGNKINVYRINGSTETLTQV
jgi:hypothetical protein